MKRAFMRFSLEPRGTTISRSSGKSHDFRIWPFTSVVVATNRQRSDGNTSPRGQPSNPAAIRSPKMRAAGAGAPLSVLPDDGAGFAF